MVKILILVAAFATVAFAAPKLGFSPAVNAVEDHEPADPQNIEKRSADVSGEYYTISLEGEPSRHIEKRSVDAAAVDDADKKDEQQTENANAPVPEAEQNAEEHNKIKKREVILSYPYAQYRYGFNPYRIGYYPQQAYYEPAAGGLVYPYQRLLSYIPGLY